jgi:hypothetical protein
VVDEQVPVPLQVNWTIAFPAHAVAPHDVFSATSWQPPLPSHEPVLPHGGSAVHWVAGAGGGGLLTGMALHVPVVPPVSALVHPMQVPVHATLQQTPFAQ